MSYRVESDLLGTVEVPAGAVYGAQTQRAIANFPLGRQRSLGSFPTLLTALLRIKQAAAVTNVQIGALSEEIGNAIHQAAERVLKENHFAEFPIHSLHGGGGTSANMNANEVLANFAEESLGGQRGTYGRVHPNDHVNLNQSTNDVYPTACRIAVMLAWPATRSALARLASAFERKAAEFRKVRRLARTCLQDAVEISFADFFGGYAAVTARRAGELERAVSHLRQVNLGGTLVGRSTDVPQAYFERIVSELNRQLPGLELRRSDNLFDAAQNIDEMAAVSSQLDLLARSLVKTARDFRLLGSGPEAGLGELRLPAVQPGSSAMPGKINPVMPEFLMQNCFRIMGHHAACLSALEHGELDLNVWESLAVTSLLESLELMESAVRAFAERCCEGLDVDVARNEAHAGSQIPRLAALARALGYSRVVALCKREAGNPEQLNQAIAELERELKKDQT